MLFLAGFDSVLIMAIWLPLSNYEQFYREMRSAVKNSAVSLSDLVNSQGTELSFDSKSPEANRITLVDTDGTVLFDNKSTKMENHLDRQNSGSVKMGGAKMEQLSKQYQIIMSVN